MRSSASRGVQTQYAPSAYIGLWSRVAGFERDDLTGALGRRTVIQATLMRATIHIVSREGTWDQRRADLFGLAETWLGPSTASADDGVRRLVRRYLLAFGPASRRDL